MKLRFFFCVGNDIKNVDHSEDILINRDNKIKKRKKIKNKIETGLPQLFFSIVESMEKLLQKESMEK